MKIIKQVKLFFKEGNSDKVYEIDLCEINESSYNVNFRYGRRGNTLKEGTKTPDYVSKAKAESLFAELEHEKRKKGYQSDLEIFVELPSIASVEKNTVKGSILQRLEDATQGINSFKTEWKTSRVIWKAAVLDIKEAIPFIIKLTNKGDEMQLYASVFALFKLNAVEAITLLESIAVNNRHRDYIKNLAFEALLSIANNEVVEKTIAQLLDLLNPELKYFIEKGDYESLKKHLFERFEKNEKVDSLPIIYLLSKQYQSLTPIVNELLAQTPFAPPYFKSIRAIYKLSKYRNDFATLALLAYLFEKKDAMFFRKASLAPDAENKKQYILAFNENVNIGKELRSNDSRLAYSQYTKVYLQKNTVHYLNSVGERNAAKDYLKLAVNVLLQYTESDYKAAMKEPLSSYGSYDYKSKKYIYTVVQYPEFYNSFLVSSILFGNDKNRTLNNNLRYFTNKENFWSNEYYYNESKVSKLDSKQNNTKSQANRANSSGNEEPISKIDLFVNTIKGFWSKPKTEPKADSNYPDPEEIPQPLEKDKVNVNRLELFPEHWDAFPQAYIQLLMQARVNRIQQFAYENLKNHAKYDDLIKQLSGEHILELLNKSHFYSNEFGNDILKNRAEEFVKNEIFVAKVLLCNHLVARNWARAIIEQNANQFTLLTEFNVLIILNNMPDQEAFIQLLLSKANFSNEQLQAIVGKVVIELLSFTNTESNNNKAKLASNRLKSIAQNQLSEISWEIIAQLLVTGIEGNTLLASEILLLKTQHVASTDIPLTIIDILLKQQNTFIRNNGIQLLNQYPIAYILEHWNVILQHLANTNKDVVENILNLNKNIIQHNQQATESLIYALIRKEYFEGAYQLFKSALFTDCKAYIEAIPSKMIIKLLFSFQRESQLAGSELLHLTQNHSKFSIKQVISLAGHELLAVRQWSWQFYKNNVERIKQERNQSLGILDTKWDDSREFAFHYFNTTFTEADWDTDCLIGIVDSVRPDVEKFGKDLIMKFFQREQGTHYLTHLSQHPSVNIQQFVANYLEEYASNNVEKLKELEFYFRAVLTRVNKARITKNRIFQFLENEGKKSESAAQIVSTIIDDIAATTAIQDKERCVEILTELKLLYPNLNLHLHLIA